MPEATTKKSFTEQFRETFAETWMPRVQELKGWGKAALLVTAPLVVAAICVAQPFIPLFVVGMMILPVMLDKKHTLQNAWKETKQLYRESFNFVRGQLTKTFTAAPAPQLAPPAAEAPAFQAGSSKTAFNQETQPAAAVVAPKAIASPPKPSGQ
jgi:hypothetical protein